MKGAVHVAVLACAAALAGAGCGGDDKDDYADQISTEMNALGSELTALGETGGARAEQVAALQSAETAIREAAGAFEAVEPPDDVADLHEELVGVLRTYETELVEAQEAVEFGDRQGAAEFLQASEAFGEAVLDLNERFREADVPFEPPPQT